jgi:hypothetical protein
MQAKNPHRVRMLRSPPEPLLAKARFNRVQQKKGFLRRPVLHRPKNLMAGVWRCEKLEVRIICDCAGAYQQFGLGQLLEAGDEVSIPGYSEVSIRPSLSQAGELQTPKETLGRHCQTVSILPVMTVSIECREHAILGIIQPK